MAQSDAVSMHKGTLMRRHTAVSLPAGLSASADAAQGYVGDVAIEEDDVELRERHYSPFLGRSHSNRTDDVDAGKVRSVADSAADRRQVITRRW